MNKDPTPDRNDYLLYLISASILPPASASHRVYFAKKKKNKQKQKQTSQTL